MLCGLAVRDPWGQPKWFAYVGESLGRERTTRTAAKMDLDRMMREAVALGPWTWGPLRTVSD